MRQAIRLDPTSPRLYVGLGHVLADAGDLEAAITQYSRAIELQPGYAAAFLRLGAAYEELGRDQDAVAAYLRAASLSGENAETVARLSAAIDLGGMQSFWTARLEPLKANAKADVGSPIAFASIYVRLRRHDDAVLWLQRAYRQHLPALAWINARREWAPLRTDARFRAILKKMNFPSSQSHVSPASAAR